MSNIDDNQIVSADNVQNDVAVVNDDRKYDTAIASLWFGLNYGSILTAYALYEYAIEIGKKPVLISKPSELWNEHYSDRDNIAGRFIYKNCNVTEPFNNTDELKAQLGNIDNYIVGSDATWNYEICGRETGKFFFFDYANDDATRIAVGSSIGRSYDSDRDSAYFVSKEMQKFKGISVKESEESDFIAEKFGLDSNVILDPVFLCNSEKFVERANEAVAKKVEECEDFIFCDILGGDKRKRLVINTGSDILRMPYRNFIDINRFPESKKALHLDVAYHIMTEDWLWYLINSKFVIADSYYAMCFAIIFKKPFIVLANENFGDMYKFENLLSALDLTDRLVILQDDLKTKEYLFRKPIRFDKVQKKLDKLINSSDAWLKSMLNIVEGESK